MGNGADKLIRRFEKYGIKISDIFASDGFVRGHSYAGFRVKSLSEIKETYQDFVIVLSFASNRPDVIDMLAKIDSQFEMYVPDMPVTDESEYFDSPYRINMAPHNTQARAPSEIDRIIATKYKNNPWIS